MNAVVFVDDEEVDVEVSVDELDETVVVFEKAVVLVLVELLLDVVTVVDVGQSGQM